MIIPLLRAQAFLIRQFGTRVPQTWACLTSIYPGVTTTPTGKQQTRKIHQVILLLLLMMKGGVGGPSKRVRHRNGTMTVEGCGVYDVCLTSLIWNSPALAADVSLLTFRSRAARNPSRQGHSTCLQNYVCCPLPPVRERGGDSCTADSRRKEKR